MDELKLGNTELSVSELCLGTMLFGSKTDEETSRELLDRYAEEGGRFIDTANAYARWIEGCQGGESEALLGRWMAERGNRQDLVVASKVGFPSPVDTLDFGLRAQQIEHAAEQSLRRLQTDYLDLYYVHADDRQAPLAERLEAFDRLVRAGKVRYTGASNTAAWRLEEARCLAREFGTEASYYCCVQQRYSYVRPQAGAIYDPHVYVNEEFLDYARTRDLTILAYSPLLGSAYQREDRDFPEQYKGPDTDTRMGVIREVAEETEATPNQLVLAWMLQSDPPVIPVIGGSSVAQLEELLDALEVELSLEQLERLSKAGNKPATHSNAQRQTPDGAKQG